MISLDDIEISNYVFGIHSFLKDHNFSSFRADYINDIQNILNIDLQPLRIGPTEILKSDLNSELELKLAPNALIYQNNCSFDELMEIAKKLLELWVTYSPKQKFSLVGLVTNFIIEGHEPRNYNEMNIQNSLIKVSKIGKKLQGIDLVYKYEVNYMNYDYNVVFQLNETHKPSYSYSGLMDFYSKSDNRMTGIPKENIEKILVTARNYYNDEITNLINCKG